MKRYYMTAESADDELCEHQGNIRGARKIAQRIANERKETIFINDAATEEIIDCGLMEWFKSLIAKDFMADYISAICGKYVG